MPGLVLAYDADCGPCTRFKRFVDLLDRNNRLTFVSLMEADESGLLDSVPKGERHTSFHLIPAGGEVLSGAAAVPCLMESLPGGAAFSRLVSNAPGGLRLISLLYASFSRGHDGAACRYHRSITGSGIPLVEPVSESPRRAGHSRATYLLAGIVGGLVGSLAMGLFVGLPDALCVGLATAIAGRTLGSYFLAWALHVTTGVLIGAVFGNVAGMVRVGDRRPLGHSVLLGTLTGVLVWSAFFMPSMLHFMPWLVTPRLLEASLAAHVVLGLVLGATLSVALWRSRGQAGRPRTAPAATANSSVTTFSAK